MKKKVAGAFLGIALAGLSSTPANAGAYGGSSYTVPYFSWTGMYVGGQAGAGWADTHWLNNHFTGVGTCAATVNFNLQRSGEPKCHVLHWRRTGWQTMADRSLGFRN
jgi:opacity protein-like surface antigen